MVDSIDFEDLLDAPRMRVFRVFGAHLRMRARLLASLFVFGLIVGYPLAGELIDWLLVQPKLIPDDASIVTLQPLELVLLRLQLAGYLSIGLVVVALIFDAARYAGKNEHVSEFLSEAELPEIPSGAFFRGFIAVISAITLAIFGLIYAWEILIPFLLEYLQEDASSAGLETTWHLQAWIGFIASLALGSALAFQVPLAVLVVLRGGLVERQLMTKYRRHLWFASIVIGAMLSPPDPLSLALIAAPMIVLFEIALIIDSIIPQKE
ncbi:MAG: twin-arginine translocase subunit TatC [Candidatus Thalassarchaeaceae archaeon]|jgi:sec-independent protein translocase protein TatC|nr:twin-arginine translocase subunit TatC [Candidatus Thalassarchaeaceae archaeon]